jgi:16S rRNA (guanine527-N7)-methyltransferase
MNWGDLGGLFPDFPGQSRWLPLLVRHAELLQQRRSGVNLTAVSPSEAVKRHYAESLEIWRVAMSLVNARTVVDIGSGAGFPGLVAATVSTEPTFHLLEPQRKRAQFLEETAAELGLANIVVHPLRAEEAGRGPLREQADLVLARAVGPVSLLVEYASPLARPGARIALPKGSAGPLEVRLADDAVLKLACRTLGVFALRREVSDTPWLVALEKVDITPARFPRRAGIPAKRPL